MLAVFASVAVITALAALLYAGFDRQKRPLDEGVRTRAGGTYAALTNGVTHYELSGPESAETVVFLHGGTIPMWAWDRQVEAFAAEDFRVLRYDQFGRGYSDRPRVRYDRALYRRQLVELLDRLELTQPIHLVGHSFGGPMAADFAAHYPERIARLVLVSPMFDLLRYRSPFRQPAAILRIPLFARLFMRFVLVPKSVGRARALLRSGGVEHHEQRFLEQMSYPGFERSLFSLLRNDAVGEYRETFRIISQRTPDILLVWGSADTNTPREVIDDVRAWLPGVRYLEMKGVGHQPNWEAAGEFNRTLIDFLKAQRGGPFSGQAQS